MHGFVRTGTINIRRAFGAARPISRGLSLRSMSEALIYEIPGEPSKVLSRQSLDVGDCGDGEVKVKMLAAAINPSDINTVQGKYPIQPKLPGVPGNEGVGEVVEVGSKVEGVKIGDWVVPLEAAQGTWRTLGVFKATNWHVVPNDIPVEAAATLTINPPTALAMLEQFVALQSGDVVVQNGANSAVGQAVIQLSRAKGLKTVNIIRDRPDWDSTVSWLKDLGADVVTTEVKLKEDMAAAGLPEAALGLNCVGGSSSSAVAKTLRAGGTLVTYGGMSMQPVTLPTSIVIFKDIICRGFWLSGRWAKTEGAKAKLLDRLLPFIRAGQLNTRCELVPFSSWEKAMEQSQAGFTNSKVLIDFSK